MTHCARIARLLLLLPVLSACAGAEAPGAASGGGPQRVAVMAPAAAEMLASLGRAERVVAVGDFVDRPPSLTGLPRLGAYDAPNVERLLELEVELLVTTDSRAAAAAHARLEQLGIRVLPLDTSTYDGIFESLDRLGREVDAEAAAAAIAAEMRRRIDAVRERCAGLEPRRVLVVVGRDPLYVAGPGSHLDALIRIAGGTNVAADAASPYERMSVESMLERMPEVIVDTSENAADAAYGRITGAWNRWPFLPAVTAGQVWQVAPGHLVIPGVRLAEMAEMMARLVRPETFGAPSDAALGPGVGG